MLKLLEYSIESYRDEAVRLAELVAADGYCPDCVAYLAKGGWQIGEECSRFFGASLIELSAHRSGEEAKKRTANVLQVLPRPFRHFLREAEIRKRFESDDKRQTKTMRVTDRFELPSSPQKILLVDDSADTGCSIAAALDLLSVLFPDSQVRVAVINSFEPARNRACIDWSLQEDCLICSPMSKDNKDFARALLLYENGSTKNSSLQDKQEQGKERLT